MFKKLNEIIGIDSDRKAFSNIENLLNLQKGQFKYYIDNNLLPTSSELKIISTEYGISPTEIKLQLGKSDIATRKKLAGIEDLTSSQAISFEQKLKTEFGELYQGDCLTFLKTLPSNSIDLVFADPPFNLNKEYKSKMDDNISNLSYLSWCEDWLDECVRVLKYGGSLYLWNLPKWNTYFSTFLNDRLIFKNWIATDMKFSLPISGRLYPSHYSLLYYTKGIKPNVFHPDRLPLDLCKKCYREIKDYGGYKSKLNPKGINITDVWTDIPPVRHKSHKRREGANELSVKLLDRIIEMSSNENDLIFDPFGGSGTTYAVAEIKKRKWLGIELGPVDDIIERFNLLEQDCILLNRYRENINQLFPSVIKDKRKQLGYWTDESFIKNIDE
jgi:site-specific DNA-methyltransferase (adenine-specific)